MTDSQHYLQKTFPFPFFVCSLLLDASASVKRQKQQKDALIQVVVDKIDKQVESVGTQLSSKCKKTKWDGCC
jgi:hypothetical protein